MPNVVNPPELLKIALHKYGSYAEICRRTGLNKSTLRRIANGIGKGKWHPKTIGKLAKAINND